jgi:ABC-type phosphate transport system substrate-binding protein
VASVEWKLIVHPANALRSIAREELERIYRRRNRFWPDHSAILPLNLSGSDPLRHAFSTEILRSNEDELATYWNREYFQGVPPPAVLQSSGAVRAYVAATPGAIGYVRPDAVDSSVAVVEVTNVH